MSTTYFAHEYGAWDGAGLKGYSDFSEKITYVHQAEIGEGEYKGDWYYADDETLTIYYGTFGNDHSPGADYYTRAEVYDDAEDYIQAKENWETCPEYDETDTYADPDDGPDELTEMADYEKADEYFGYFGGDDY